MSWQDLGVIVNVDKLHDWAQSHFYVPTVLDKGDVLRVYGAFWDADQYGRLGYVDLDPHDLSVKKISDKPCMSDSAKGMFDCDGVTPMAVARDGDQVRLYYTGWHKDPCPDVRYTLFTGLAVSDDGGTSFTRYPVNPVLGKREGVDDEVRTGIMMPDGLGWRYWGAEFAGAIELNGYRTPSYHFTTSYSDDGVTWPDRVTMIYPVTDTIFGYGRSAIWHEEGHYHGLFSARHRIDGYKTMLYAISSDGIVWSPLSEKRYSFSVADCTDPQNMVAFPSIIHQADRKIMFYNGSDFGKAGLRTAIWTD